MIKRLLIIVILSTFTFSCGKKGDPEYNETSLQNLNQSRLI